MFWGRAGKSKACVRRFVEALNARDFPTMSDLIAHDFCYIDSWREGVQGREKILAALQLLIEQDPDFAMQLDRMSYQGGHVLMSGRIMSSVFGQDRRAVWRVTCDGEKLLDWQSWAEMGPPPMTRVLLPLEARDFSYRSAEKPDAYDD